MFDLALLMEAVCDDCNNFEGRTSKWGGFSDYSGNVGAGGDVGGNYLAGYGTDGTPVFGGGATLGLGTGARSSWTTIVLNFNIFWFFTNLWNGCI